MCTISAFFLINVVGKRIYNCFIILRGFNLSNNKSWEKPRGQDIMGRWPQPKVQSSNRSVVSTVLLSNATAHARAWTHDIPQWKNAFDLYKTKMCFHSVYINPQYFKTCLFKGIWFVLERTILAACSIIRTVCWGQTCWRSKSLFETLFSPWRAPYLDSHSWLFCFIPFIKYLPSAPCRQHGTDRGNIAKEERTRFQLSRSFDSELDGKSEQMALKGNAWLSTKEHHSPDMM